MLGKLSLIVLSVILIFRVTTFCDSDFIRCYKRFKFYRVEDYGSKVTLLSNIRSKVGKCYSDLLPPPVSYLVLGMVLGLDEFDKVPEFKKALKATGTVHAVVVSGYNMNLVFAVLMRILGNPYSYFTVFVTLFFGAGYALLTGFEPPVMRALVMSSALLVNRFWGRAVSIFVVLFFSAWVLLMFIPNLIFNLSFLLSFGASLSLVCYSEIISRFVEKTPLKYLPLKDDVISTAAAQVLVWPLLAIYFGTFNVLGFITNPLLLWSVPLTTLGGGVLALLCYLPKPLWFITELVGLAVRLPAEFFSRGVTEFSQFSFLNNFLSLGLTTSLMYYLGAAIFFIIARNKNKK